MMSVENRTGRLCEVRFQSPITAAEVTGFLTQLGALVKSARARWLFCSDMRDALVMPSETADVLLDALKRDNPLIERHGVLLGESALFGLQIERMLKNAGSPARRTFRNEADLHAWMAPLFTPDEAARARAFYAERGAPTR
jgi:hypothetical protein